MAKTKTTYTGQDVIDFVNSYVDNEQKKSDSFRLIELMQEWSDAKPKMWGPSIIGFGNYHYKYASGHEGDAPVLGFSPRKAALTFYVYSDTERSKLVLAKPMLVARLLASDFPSENPRTQTRNFPYTLTLPPIMTRPE